MFQMQPETLQDCNPRHDLLISAGNLKRYIHDPGFLSTSLPTVMQLAGFMSAETINFCVLLTV